MKISIKKTFLPVCAFLLIAILAANVSADFLRISDVELSSVDRNAEVKPHELLTISFDVNNEGEDKIEDVEATVYFERNGKKMRDDKDDDIEFDFDLDYIKGDKSKTTEFSFNIPFDVQDGQIYDVVIEAKGRNSTDREKYEDTDRSESFEIIKDRHELLFNKLNVYPTTLSCDRTLHVEYDLRDIGEKDEDGNLTIINDILNANVSENFHLESDYDEDNKWEQSHIFVVPTTVNPGTYGLTINLYYDDGNKHQYNTTNIVIQDCAENTGTGTSSNDSGTTANNNAGSSGSTNSGNVDVVYTQPAAAVPAAAPQKSSQVDLAVVLIVVAVVVILLLIILIVVLLSRK